MLKDGYEYQIQRSDGLFSTGGYWPRFSKRGKIWRGLGPLKLHLRNLDNHKKRYPQSYVDCYKDCVVVKYAVTKKVVEDGIALSSLFEDVK
jgi:hypothetical protein